MECTLSTNNDLYMDRSNPLHGLSQKLQKEKPRRKKNRKKTSKKHRVFRTKRKLKDVVLRVRQYTLLSLFIFSACCSSSSSFFFLSFFHFLETELLRLTKHDNSIYRFCNDSLNVLYYYDLLHPLGQLWQALGIRLTKLQTLFFLSSAPYYRPTCICTCICTVFL